MKINITKTQRARLVKDWLNDMFSGVEVIKRHVGTYYVKKGEHLAFQHDIKKTLWFDYDTIWSFLESMFSLKDEELKAITEDWVEETLNIKGYSTVVGMWLGMQQVEETLNIKGEYTTNFDK